MLASFEDIVRHEAAHAVVAHVLGLRVDRLLLFKPVRADDEWGGGVVTRGASGANGANGAIVAMAGPAADERWMVQSPSADSDPEHALALVGGGEEQLVPAQLRARELVVEHADTVERVGRELVARIDEQGCVNRQVIIGGEVLHELIIGG